MVKTVIICFMLTVSVICPIVGDVNAESHRLISPDKLWQGYDPSEEPLEEQILSRWIDGGIEYKEVYFTGLTDNGFGEPVRVYAIYAAPVNADNLPAIVHLHGGGQTVNKNWLRFWANRGYAALTFNCHGRWENRDKYTLYGKLLQGNHKDSSADVLTPPTSSRWYIWAVISRRAITYLQSQSEVDPDRIGAFGISMGGTTIWNIANDSRLKAVCAIYGVGWTPVGHWRYPPRYALNQEPTSPENDDVLTWISAMAPQSYPPYIQCPVLFMSSTNDHHGNMDRSFDTLALLPDNTERRQAFTPRFGHHIGADFVNNLPLWMDSFLKGNVSWPRTPEMELTIDPAGIPVVRVKPDLDYNLEKVDVFYAIENPWSVNRNWRTVIAQEEQGQWIAKLPVFDTSQYLFVFTNLHYRKGMVLSSDMKAVIPADLGKAKATDKWSSVIYNGSDGMGCWATNSPSTDPIPPVPVPLWPSVGPDGRKGFSVRKQQSPRTYQLGDPKWRGPKDASLAFDVASTVPQEFRVAVYKNYYRPGQEKFTARVNLEGNGSWQTIRLAVDDFKSERSSDFLDSWESVSVLELEKPVSQWSDEDIVWTNFRWELKPSSD